MKRLAIVLMTLLVTLDAVPVQAFLAAQVHKPALECCCKGVCQCRHCLVHRPHGAKLTAGMCVIDCAGCTGSASHGGTIPSASLYELSAAGTLLAFAASERVARSPFAAPASSPQRLPDPPPRLAAA